MRKKLLCSMTTSIILKTMRLNVVKISILDLFSLGSYYTGWDLPSSQEHSFKGEGSKHSFLKDSTTQSKFLKLLKSKSFSRQRLNISILWICLDHQKRNIPSTIKGTSKHVSLLLYNRPVLKR